MTEGNIVRLLKKSFNAHIAIGFALAKDSYLEEQLRPYFMIWPPLIQPGIFRQGLSPGIYLYIIYVYIYIYYYSSALLP